MDSAPGVFTLKCFMRWAEKTHRSSVSFGFFFKWINKFPITLINIHLLRVLSISSVYITSTRNMTLFYTEQKKIDNTRTEINRYLHRLQGVFGTRGHFDLKQFIIFDSHLSVNQLSFHVFFSRCHINRGSTMISRWKYLQRFFFIFFFNVLF